jgi:hypothetical protein
MAKAIQKHPRNEDRILYHHGLIKMIVLYELQRNDTTWEKYLADNGFTDETIREDTSSKSEEEEKDDSDQPSKLQETTSMGKRKSEIEWPAKQTITYQRRITRAMAKELNKKNEQSSQGRSKYLQK